MPTPFCRVQKCLWFYWIDFCDFSFSPDSCSVPRILRFALLLLSQDSWDLWPYPLHYWRRSAVFTHSGPPDPTAFFCWLTCWFLLDSLSFSFHCFFIIIKKISVSWLNLCFLLLTFQVHKLLIFLIHFPLSHLCCWLSSLGPKTIGLLYSSHLNAGGGVIPCFYKWSLKIFILLHFTHFCLFGFSSWDLLEESHFCACLCSSGSCPVICTSLGAHSSLCYLVLS